MKDRFAKNMKHLLNFQLASQLLRAEAHSALQSVSGYRTADSFPGGDLA
jgi:hypothetical protein